MPNGREHQTFVYSVDSAANIKKGVEDTVAALTQSILAVIENEKEQNEAEDTNAFEFNNDAILDGAQVDVIDVIPDQIKLFAYLVNCVVHKFQLAVNKFLFKEENIHNIVLKAVALSTKLRTSIVRMELTLENLKQAKTHQLTRWNSVEVMLERVLELRDFCARHEDDDDHEELRITAQSWDQFANLLSVLKIAATLTTVLQKENLLIPDFIYHWFSMKLALEGMINTNPYAKYLMKYVKIREKEIMVNKVVQAGWFLDKSVGLMIDDPEVVIGAKDIIRMIHKKRNNIHGTVDDKPTEGEIGEAESEVDLEPGPEPNSLDHYLKTLGEGRDNEARSGALGTSSRRATENRLELEIKKYEDSAPPSKRINTIAWWLENEEKFPLLCPIALDIISAPITEVSVERLFSHLGIILTKFRSTLKGPLLEDILFLRLNKIFNK